MYQDIAAARVVFACGAPLVQLPCRGVVSALTTTGPELNAWIKGANSLSDYLLEHTTKTAEAYAKGKAWSRCIWDVSAIAWLLNDKNKLMESYVMPSLIPQYDHTYSIQPTRPPMRYVYHVYRDAIFTDLFTNLKNFKEES
jgi:inosine-uridine nucleoside N-ribohydrolase